MITVFILLASCAAAEPFTDRIERDYIDPVLEQIQGALEGREPSWTPPVLPGMPQTRAFSDELVARWIEPLIENDMNFAQSAALTLASPRLSEPPADISISEIVPLQALSPEAAAIVDFMEQRFLTRLFPGDYIMQAAQALGSGRPDEEGPAEPDLDALSHIPAGLTQAVAPQEGAGLDTKAPLPSKDSTRLVRGGIGNVRPKLKPIRSRFTATSTP